MTSAACAIAGADVSAAAFRNFHMPMRLPLCAQWLPAKGSSGSWLFRCRSHTFTSAGSPIFEAVLHGRHLCGVIVPTIARRRRCAPAPTR